jgi:hypothetical protein
VTKRERIIEILWLAIAPVPEPDMTGRQHWALMVELKASAERVRHRAIEALADLLSEPTLES